MKGYAWKVLVLNKVAWQPLAKMSKHCCGRSLTEPRRADHEHKLRMVVASTSSCLEKKELQSPTRRGRVHVFRQGSRVNIISSRRKMDQTPDFVIIGRTGKTRRPMPEPPHPFAFEGPMCAGHGMSDPAMPNPPQFPGRNWIGTDAQKT